MVAKGCRSCRRRHVKCRFDKPHTACAKCVELGQAALCELEPPFRFKQVTHVHEKVGDVRQRYDFTWDDQQVWVDPDGVSFAVDPSTTVTHDDPAEIITEPNNATGDTTDTETVQVIERADDTARDKPQTSTRAHNDDWLQYATSTPGNASLVDRGGPSNWGHPPSLSPAEWRTQPLVSPLGANSLASEPDGSVRRQQSVVEIATTPGQRSSWLGNTTEIYTPRSHIGRSPPSLAERIPLLPREAVLLRYYVSKLAPLFDVCDAMSHFAGEVPRRALHTPMILHAILALASRMQFLVSGSDELESRRYHNECLQSLIPALSRDKDSYDDNLLVTITILKFYEELDAGAHPKSHLLGSQKLLNAVPNFSSSGGLAEAASWQILRATIYECMVHQEPWHLCLENYEPSSVFRQSDDASYANIMVFLVGRLERFLSACRQSSAVDWTEWYWIQQQVLRWEKGRPSSFLPLDFREISFEENRPFPELWMLSPAAVVGTQFYHTAMVSLNIHQPRRLGVSAFDAAAISRKSERTAAAHIAETVGLSICHESVENAKLAACHLLSLFGYCVSHPLQRLRTCQFLQDVEQSLGWKGSEIASSLQQQWDRLDGLAEQTV